MGNGHWAYMWSNLSKQGCRTDLVRQSAELWGVICIPDLLRRMSAEYNIVGWPHLVGLVNFKISTRRDSVKVCTVPFLITSIISIRRIQYASDTKIGRGKLLDKSTVWAFHDKRILARNKWRCQNVRPCSYKTSATRRLTV